MSQPKKTSGFQYLSGFLPVLVVTMSFVGLEFIWVKQILNQPYTTGELGWFFLPLPLYCLFGYLAGQAWKKWF